MVYLRSFVVPSSCILDSHPCHAFLGSHAILDVCIVNKGKNVAHKFMYACFQGELHVVRGVFELVVF